MPIVFDQVTGTVTPELPPSGTQPETNLPSPFALDRQIQQMHAKHLRRLKRLKAD